MEEGRFQKNKKYSDGNSGENTKGTIDGENFSGGGGAEGRGRGTWMVGGCGIETHRLAERIQVDGKRPGGGHGKNTLLPL